MEEVKKYLFFMVLIGAFFFFMFFDIAFSATNLKGDYARIRVLNKQVGKAQILEIPVGQTISEDNLNISVKACYFTPDYEAKEDSVFLEISATESEDKVFDDSKSSFVRSGEFINKLFTGWMFSSSPSLSSVEHPTYDVWLLSCETF